MGKMEKKVVRDLGNMKVLAERSFNVDYLVFKCREVFSTQWPQTNKIMAKRQIVVTKGIDGEQINLWIKGEFKETNGHTPLPRPIPFELNIYIKKEEK